MQDTFIYRNRNKLSIFILIIAFISIYGDYKVTGICPTLFQWFVLILCICFIIYLKMYITIDDEVPVKQKLIIKINPKPMNQENETPETTPESKQETLLNETVNTEAIVSEAPITDAKVEEPPAEPIAEESPIADPEPKTEAPAPIVTEQGIKSFSNIGVPQNIKAMFDDIHQYGISSDKTLSEHKANLNKYGLEYQTQMKGDALVAFQFQNVRIPLRGYFTVKVD